MHPSHRQRRLPVIWLSLVAMSLAGCTPGPDGPGAPSSAAASPSPTRQLRTISGANLLSAADLPIPLGDDSTVKVYIRNARPLDTVSVCQQQPLAALGASMIKSRSFKDVYPPGQEPFPSATLDRAPDSYVIALQFPDPAAVERAKSIYQGWVVSCRAGVNGPADVRVVDGGGFDWTEIYVRPGHAEAAEVAYRSSSVEGPETIVESIGLTTVEDRMMITVHLFCTDESPYSITESEDEAEFAHPQLQLTRAAAERLSRG